MHSYYINTNTQYFVFYLQAYKRCTIRSSGIKLLNGNVVAEKWSSIRKGTSIGIDIEHHIDNSR